MNNNINSDNVQMGNVKKIVLFILGFLVLTVATIGISFAIFNVTKTSMANSITTGSITMNYTESYNGLSLHNALPVKDDIAANNRESGNYFDFSVTSTSSGAVNVPYEINISVNGDSTLDKSNVKVYLTKIVGDIEEIIVEPTNLALLEKSSLRTGALTVVSNTDSFDGEGSISTEYRLRLWIDYSADASLISDRSFSVTVNVDSSGM